MFEIFDFCLNFLHCRLFVRVLVGLSVITISFSSVVGNLSFSDVVLPTVNVDGFTTNPLELENKKKKGKLINLYYVFLRFFF